MLRKYFNGAIHRWDDYVDPARFAARIRTHRTTGHSPFFLSYGQELLLLGDGAPPILHESYEKDIRVQAEKRVLQLERLGRLREAVTRG